MFLLYTLKNSSSYDCTRLALLFSFIILMSVFELGSVNQK